MNKKWVFNCIAVAVAASACSFAGCTPEIDDTDIELPSEEMVEIFQSLADSFGNIKLTEQDGKYYATKPKDAFVVWEGATYPLAIDLGGIGKGYAADMVKQQTVQQGFEYGYFNFGSSSFSVLKAYGSSDSATTNGMFTLSFTDPRGFASSYFSTTVSDEGLSTSGDYEQYYTKNNVRYCHIINPATGKPIRVTYQAETQSDVYEAGIATVTVVGGSAAEDDALTTALAVMSKEQAISFINQKLTDRRVTFTYETEAGDIEVYTNIPKGQFTLLNSSYTVKGYGDGTGKIVEQAVEVEAPQVTQIERPTGYKQGGTEGYILGTTYTYLLVIDSANEEQLTTATNMLKWVDSYLVELENSLSTAVSTSSVARFNSAKAGEKVEIDELCYNVLSLALRMYQETEGCYNPGVFYSVDLYGFTPYSLIHA
jgi:thiamine biosynthesis lipoprotein ApbE